MKKRIGFVSNSSSSSFILSSEKDKNTKISLEIDLSNLTDNIIKTKEELDEYFLDEFWYYGSTIKKIFEKYNGKYKYYYDELLKEIKKGNELKFIHVSNEFNAMESAIYNLEENGELEDLLPNNVKYISQQS